MIEHKNIRLENINLKNTNHYVQQHENRNIDSPPVYWSGCNNGTETLQEDFGLRR